MRIKGPNFKRNRCCGRKRTLKTCSIQRKDGSPDTGFMWACEVCGKGYFLPESEWPAAEKEFARV